MPITIDGNTVGAVSIDGVDVGEITMDGETVWSSGYKVFAGDQTGYLDALYPVNSRIWRIAGTDYHAGADTTWNIAANPADEVVYAGIGGSLFKIDYEGNVKWHIEPTSVRWIRGVATYGSYVYAAAGDSRDDTDLGLYKYDSSGNQQWYYDQGVNYWCFAVVCDDNGNAYVMKGEEVHKVDASGNQQWVEDSWSYTLNDLALGDSYLWVGSGDNLKALSKSDGSVVKDWTTAPWSGSLYMEPEAIVTGPNNYIYFFNNDVGNEKIYKIDANGNKQWEYSIGNLVRDMTITPDLELYATWANGYLSKIDASTGNLLWTYGDMPNTPRSAETEVGTRKAFPTYW